MPSTAKMGVELDDGGIRSVGTPDSLSEVKGGLGTTSLKLTRDARRDWVEVLP